MLKRVGDTFFWTGPAFLSKGQCDEAGTGQAGHWRAASSLQVSALATLTVQEQELCCYLQNLLKSQGLL
jgi:hypothetical protein